MQKPARGNGASSSTVEKSAPHTVSHDGPRGAPKTGSDGESDDFDARVARLLAKQRKKADQLRRFKEKQKRYRRWIPLRAPIDWLASFNSQGERTAPNDGKAMLFTAEIWNVFCGRDIFTKFQLGNKELPWCIIEDAHPEYAISRFTRSDLLISRVARIDLLASSAHPSDDKQRLFLIKRRSDLLRSASDDKQMLLAFIKRLWVPRVSLLNLFQERRWPVPLWLEEPQSTLVAKDSLASTNQKRHSMSGLERAYASRRAGGYMPTITEDKEWAKANCYPDKRILKLRRNYENRPPGRQKISDPK